METENFLDELEQEEIAELLEEEFDPNRFYKALAQAIVQLENFSDEVAA